jgi:hypothetical protein
LLLLPAFPLLSGTGVEPFAWPPQDKWGLLAINIGLDAAFNLSLLVGIASSSPLAMAVAQMLVVPATLVVRLPIRRQPWVVAFCLSQ